MYTLWKSWYKIPNFLKKKNMPTVAVDTPIGRTYLVKTDWKSAKSLLLSAMTGGVVLNFDLSIFVE